jgi:opacity protein-like surface antigen
MTIIRLKAEMKKVLILLTSFIISFSIFSQESKITIGLEIAPSITSLRGNTEFDSSENLFVLSPGVTFDYYISQNLALQSGISFERKGGKTELLRTFSNIPIGSQEIQVNLDYVTLPLMLTYSTNGKISFYIGGGAFLGFLVSHKVIWGSFENFNEAEFGDTEDFPEGIEDLYNTNIRKKIDLGLSLMTGVKIPITKRIFIDLGIRDYLGLLNINNTHSINIDTGDLDIIKTNSLSLVAGIEYRI